MFGFIRVQDRRDKVQCRHYRFAHYYSDSEML